MGWKKVHEALLKKPFSESLEQIVADRKCHECGVGCFVGTHPLCWLCEVTEREIALSFLEECEVCQEECEVCQRSVRECEVFQDCERSLLRLR